MAFTLPRDTEKLPGGSINDFSFNEIMNFIGRAEQKEVEFEHPEPFHAGDLHLEPEESLPDRSKPKEALLLTVCPLSLCKLPRQSFYHPGSKSCGMRSICLYYLIGRCKDQRCRNLHAKWSCFALMEFGYCPRSAERDPEHFRIFEHECLIPQRRYIYAHSQSHREDPRAPSFLLRGQNYNNHTELQKQARVLWEKITPRVEGEFGMILQSLHWPHGGVLDHAGFIHFHQRITTLSSLLEDDPSLWTNKQRYAINKSHPEVMHRQMQPQTDPSLLAMLSPVDPLFNEKVNALHRKVLSEFTDLFVGNLEEFITEDELRSFFEVFGPIRHVTRKSDEKQEYAIVHFQFRENAELAFYHMEGYPIGSRRIRVRWAPQRLQLLCNNASSCYISPQYSWSKYRGAQCGSSDSTKPAPALSRHSLSLHDRSNDIIHHTKPSGPERKWLIGFGWVDEGKTPGLKLEEDNLEEEMGHSH